jgi:hypothetical protein
MAHLNNHKTILTVNSGAASWDFSEGNCAFISLSANATLTLTNMPPLPCSGMLEVYHATAGTTITSFPGDASEMRWKTGPAQTTLVGFYYNGDTFIWFSHVAGAAAEPVDITSPVLQSALVSASTPNQIELHYNEFLASDFLPSAGDFAPSGSKTITGVAISGSKVILTVNTDYAIGDVITVSYTAGTNPIKDIAGNQAVNLSAQAVNNFITPLLDAIGTASGAYSLRKLRAAYAGSAVRVRRSSDNTEQDIGFTAKGDFDSAAFSTFVGAGQGYVTRWYDQSTALKDAIQATTTLQPEIKLAVTNNRPAPMFNGGYLTIAASQAAFKALHSTFGSLAVVVQPGITTDPNAAYGIFGNNGASSSNIGFNLHFDDRVATASNNGIAGQTTSGGGTTVGRAGQSDVITPNKFSVITASTKVADATLTERFRIWVNKGAVIPATVTTGTNGVSTANATYDAQIGATGNNVIPITGYIAELIVSTSDFDSDPTMRNTVIDNQTAYYGIS